MTDLIFLFFSAFFAATIFPAQSELVLFSLNLAGQYSKIILLLVATTGNVLGAVVNYFLGFYLLKLKDKKWFKLNEKQINKFTLRYEKWGKWSLLFAWMPIIGDPLTVVAGIFKTNFWLFLLLVTIGKAARYIVFLLG